MTPDARFDPSPPDAADRASSPFEARMRNTWTGPNGIRAGWRLLIAIFLFFAFATLLSLLAIRIPSARALLLARTGNALVITPAFIFLSEGPTLAAALLAALVMTQIEKRSFADYSLPGNQAFGKRYWQGIVYGFIMVSFMMGLLTSLHGFSSGGYALAGVPALRYGGLYFIGFMLVAFFEEFSFRGYLQATLASAMGFWPAALALAIVFGAIHLTNPGEARFGALAAGAFGLFCAFTLRRTGSIWFAIGAHCAWDWGETFFYSVPDSGVLAEGHLMNSSFHGPVWLTGGSVGPEGSVFVLIVLALAALGVHYIFPAKSAATAPALSPSI
jgi:uncharacterized protein